MRIYSLIFSFQSKNPATHLTAVMTTIMTIVSALLDSWQIQMVFNLMQPPLFPLSLPAFERFKILKANSSNVNSMPVIL